MVPSDLLRYRKQCRSQKTATSDLGRTCETSAEATKLRRIDAPSDTSRSEGHRVITYEATPLDESRSKVCVIRQKLICRGCLDVQRTALIRPAEPPR